MADKVPPNYYAILEISETATTDQVRNAYKRAALRTHPDRVPSDSPERPMRTRKFQLVNDAYYTLSDTSRRRKYDAQRRMFGGGRDYTDPFADADSTVPPSSNGNSAHGNHQQQQQEPGQNNFYSWAWNFFTGSGQPSQHQNTQQARQEAEDEQFADVFEEMLREEGMAEDGTNQPTSKFWSILGAASGGVMGFIVANVPGMVAGAVAGNRLGAVRDARGKSVYAVFQELPQGDRSRLLAQLASRVFSHAMGV